MNLYVRVVMVLLFKIITIMEGFDSKMLTIN